MEFIWNKVEEKFHKVNLAFGYFDINHNSRVSLNEFTWTLERLRIKIPPQEVEKIFKHLDQDKNGFLDYNEFCGLCEEKRRNIDPFEYSPTK